MLRAKHGDTVKVHYTGRLEDGTIFDTSETREPLLFTIGQGSFVPGLDQAVVGMKPGETKKAVVSADEAYGPHQKEKVQAVNRNQFPVHLNPEIGQQFQVLSGDEPDPVLVTVTHVTRSSVILDYNHPLAGQNLIFDIRLLEIV